MRPYESTIFQLEHYLADKKKIDENQRAFLVSMLSGFTLTWPAVATCLYRQYKAKDSATRAKQCDLLLRFIQLHRKETELAGENELHSTQINQTYKNLYQQLNSILKNTMNDNPNPPWVVDTRTLPTSQWKTEFLQELINQLTQSNSTKLKSIALNFKAQQSRSQYENPQTPPHATSSHSP